MAGLWITSSAPHEPAPSASTDARSPVRVPAAPKTAAALVPSVAGKQRLRPRLGPDGHSPSTPGGARWSDSSGTATSKAGDGMPIEPGLIARPGGLPMASTVSVWP